MSYFLRHLHITLHWYSQQELLLISHFRCFVLVENSTTENITQQDSTLDSTASAQDSMLGRSLVSTVQVVFMQCSQALFEVKLYFEGFISMYT